MSNETDTIRQSSTLKQYISETEAEISKLETRRAELQQELDKIQNDVDALLGESDEASRLNNQLQNIDGGIQKRRKKVEQLNEELQQANATETREKRIQTCIKQAKKANAANEKYINLMEDLDAELVDKIAEILNTKSQLANAANSFFNTLILLEPAAKRKHNDPSNDSELIQSVEAMLNTIEERGNVDTTTARSEQFNRPHYHRKTARSIETPTVDNFGHWIRKMIDKHRARQQREAS